MRSNLYFNTSSQIAFVNPQKTIFRTAAEHLLSLGLCRNWCCGAPMFSWAPDYCCSLNISGISILQLRTMLLCAGCSRKTQIKNTWICIIIIIAFIIPIICYYSLGAAGLYTPLSKMKATECTPPFHFCFWIKLSFLPGIS